jgi:hypothetical protein
LQKSRLSGLVDFFVVRGNALVASSSESSIEPSTCQRQCCYSLPPRQICFQICQTTTRRISPRRRAAACRILTLFTHYICPITFVRCDRPSLAFILQNLLVFSTACFAASTTASSSRVRAVVVVDVTNSQSGAGTSSFSHHCLRYFSPRGRPRCAETRPRQTAPILR